MTLTSHRLQQGTALHLGYCLIMQYAFNREHSTAHALGNRQVKMLIAIGLAAIAVNERCQGGSAEGIMSVWHHFRLTLQGSCHSGPLLIWPWALFTCNLAAGKHIIRQHFGNVLNFRQIGFWKHINRLKRPLTLLGHFWCFSLQTLGLGSCTKWDLIKKVLLYYKYQPYKTLQAWQSLQLTTTFSDVANCNNGVQHLISHTI